MCFVSPNQSSVDINRWGGFQKRFSLSLLLTHTKIDLIVLLLNIVSRKLDFSLLIYLYATKFVLPPVAKTILHMFPFHVLLWLPFHFVTTNEHFRRLPTLFQALRLSGEHAEVKGMRKIGSFLPIYFFMFVISLSPRSCLGAWNRLETART